MKFLCAFIQLLALFSEFDNIPCVTASESEYVKHFAGDPGYIHAADVCTDTAGGQSSVWITDASFTRCLAYS
jgi:hypothetical protein